MGRESKVDLINKVISVSAGLKIPKTYCSIRKAFLNI